MSGRCSTGRTRLLLFIVLGCLAGGSARAVEEEDLQDLWKRHLAAVDDHDAAIRACDEYTKSHAGDALLPMVRGLVEWHHMRANRRPQALQMMAADLTAPTGPAENGARRMALAWLTRVDREQVAAVLQSYYRKKVAYPKSLDEALTLLKLPENARPPMKDRFVQPWQYALTGFAKLPGFTDQKYTLQSTALGDTSDYKDAVKLPYASRLTAAPVKIEQLPGNVQAVRFDLGGGKTAVIGAGQAAGELYLAYVGTALLVVCDVTHWKVLPRP